MNNPEPAQKSPLIYIIIINYNGFKWLDKCLRSLFETKYDNFEVILVDNDSHDESAAFVRENFPRVRVIVNADNLGFCEGNNVGIREAIENGAEYVVLLNNDTIVTENWLTEIVAVGESEPQVGVLGCVQLNYEGTGFNTFTTEEASEHLAELENPETARSWIPMRWVEGSCFAIKRHVIEEVGMLDPIYFMYYEEIDYCRRVAAHGYAIGLVPRSHIHHYRGGTSRIDSKAKRTRELMLHRNRLIYHMTDPCRVVIMNLGVYFLALGRECFGRLLRGRFTGAWELISMQPSIWRSSEEIFHKWKNDRSRFKTRRRASG